MEFSAPGILPGIPKKPFNIIGLACFMILLVSVVMQLSLFYLTRRFAAPLEARSWYVWAVTFIPLYAVAVPIGIALFRCIPAERAAVRKLRFKDLLIFLVMCFPVMYIGNIIGSLINAALHALLGTEIKNPLDALMNGSNIWLAVLVMVILAPVIEEFIFRKLIIDRMRAYGEGACVLVSGLLFGLFHGNLAQFFYAFGLGAIFAFIYLKTGRLRYPIFLHMAINLYSGIIGPLLLRDVDLDALTQAGGKDTGAMMQWLTAHLPSLMILGLYTIVNLALVITGFVLLIVRRRAFFFEHGPLQPEKGTGFQVLFLNPGMALFAAIALAMFVLSLF
jgi:membrane protease YdiL (CAAX protease family)